MATINFTIDNGKATRVVNALKGLYPIPKIDVSVKGKEGETVEPIWENEFTDAQWSKECVRRWIVKQVARWEHRQALDAVVYNEEDDIIT